MLEEGVAHAPRHRPRADGRRRPGPAPRAAAAVHEGRRHGPRRRAREARGRPRSEHGERFAPPTILRRLVAQGRLGQKSGQGFYAYPQPDEDDRPRHRGRQARDPRRRRDRVAGQRPDELDLAAGHRATSGRCGTKVKGSGVRALVIASSNPLLFSRGRRHQGVHADGRGRAGRELLDTAHALLRELGRGSASPRSPRSTASPSAAAASWRWPATCASPRSRRSSASPRSSSGSSPASAAPSACRASSARTRRSR